jgi:mRNA-degrading endonuclease toxin of MazEF toxin-antitoxin module
MIIICPITTVNKNIPTNVKIHLKRESYIKVEDVRSISKRRIRGYISTVNRKTIKEVKTQLDNLFDD